VRIAIIAIFYSIKGKRTFGVLKKARLSADEKKKHKSDWKLMPLRRPRLSALSVGARRKSKRNVIALSGSGQRLRRRGHFTDD
jgi:hypothetical protein